MAAAVIYVDIAGYEGRYSVSECGRIYSHLSNKVLSPGPTAAGYLTVNLRRDGISRSTYVHIIVAKAFIPNPDNKPTVNHEDGDRANNVKSNLEWATYGENHAHAYRVLGRPVRDMRGSKNPSARGVVGVCAAGRVESFPTLSAAAHKHGVSPKAIADACLRKGRSAGVTWSFA